MRLSLTPRFTPRVPVTRRRFSGIVFAPVGDSVNAGPAARTNSRQSAFDQTVAVFSLPAGSRADSGSTGPKSYGAVVASCMRTVVRFANRTVWLAELDDAAPAEPANAANVSKATVSATTARRWVVRREIMRRGGCAGQQTSASAAPDRSPDRVIRPLLVDDDVWRRQQVQHRLRPHQPDVLVVEELEPVEPVRAVGGEQVVLRHFVVSGAKSVNVDREGDAGWPLQPLLVLDHPRRELVDDQHLLREVVVLDDLGDVRRHLVDDGRRGVADHLSRHLAR